MKLLKFTALILALSMLTWAGGTLAGSGYGVVQSWLESLIDDTSPQLGGLLDAQGNAITNISYIKAANGVTLIITNAVRVQGTVTSGADFLSTVGNANIGNSVYAEAVFFHSGLAGHLLYGIDRGGTRKAFDHNWYINGTNSWSIGFGKSMDGHGNTLSNFVVGAGVTLPAANISGEIPATVTYASVEFVGSNGTNMVLRHWFHTDGTNYVAVSMKGSSSTNLYPVPF